MSTPMVLARVRAPSLHRVLAAVAGALVALTSAALARAQTGVSDDRVSLPEGPGSLSGLGDDVDVNAAMGQMSYAVPMTAPDGFPGLTPTLGLRYGSGNGNGVVGMGWSMDLPSVERLTMRGAPRYTVDDELIASGAGQLVYVGPGGDGSREYRARVEGGFERYRWHDVGDGSVGYWTAELPNGFIRYYGATPDGALVTSAHVGDAALGTFRWALTSIVDLYGHELRYTWSAHGTTALPARIEYVFTGGVAQYVVDFTYEPREDWLSNATGGFEEVTDVRLAEVAIASHGTPIRRYALSYEPYAESGGFTRLASVHLFGLGDAAYPAAASFHYSEALGQICGIGDGCARPFTRSMGPALGVNLGSGKATLVDMNGDGLPDIVDSSEAGQPHRIFLNHLAADGTHTMLAAKASAVGTQTAFDFSNPVVQVLDANGDGFTDVLNALSGSILYNRGGGDWDRRETAGVGAALPTEQGQLAALRFMDYDGDHRIDLIGSVGSGASNTTTIYRNTPAGFVVDEQAGALGVGFDSGALELDDVNGDGLLDAVYVTTSEVGYDLNLGWGRWAGWRVAGSVTFTDAQAKDAEVEDVNGDGLADLVLVTPDSVRMWLNRNGRAFDPERTLTAADVDGGLPTREATTTVLFADMNGNGSSDVVWITQGGLVTYLELFPVKPNLLARIENGLGEISEVSYATSVEEAARDEAAGDAWSYRLPFPNIVVKSLDTWDATTQLHRIQTWDYHDGYYDSAERQFSGYARVEQSLSGDQSQEGGASFLRYAVTDFYNAGQVLASELTSGGRSIRSVENGYADCPVGGSWSADDLRLPIRWVCQTSTLTEQREGGPSSEYVVTRARRTYDGYGNVVEADDEGIVARGGSDDCGPCERAADELGEACGPGCLGDEHVTTTDYIAPGADTGGHWLLHLPWRQRDSAGHERTDYGETLTYYDGDAFVGLPQGQATRGFVSRATQRVDTRDALVTSARARADADGNVVETIDALGSPGGDTHRRSYTMDADGLRVTQSDIHLVDAEGAYRLRRDYRYDGVWDAPSVVSAWRVVAGSDDVTPVTTSWVYDAFGRVAAQVQPGGDTVASPTFSYAYHMADPTSSVEVQSRSVVGQPMDMTAVECVDGHGRVTQRRERVDADTWQVSALSVYDGLGNDRAVFQPYMATSGACDRAPPDGVLAILNEYDALERPRRILHPSNLGHAATRLVLKPAASVEYDLDDEDATSPAHDTPLVRSYNGLGQLVAVGRTVTAGAEPETYHFAYDAQGRVARVTDPMGHTRHQSYDLLGRLVEVVDPDRGTLSYDHDALGNVVREESGAGDVVMRTFDGLGRVVEQWVDGQRDATLVTQRWDRAPDCPEDACKNGAGRLVAVTAGSGAARVSDWQSYDARGRMTLLRRDIDGVTLDTTWRYDNANRAVAQRFPGSAREVEVSYDASDAITAIAGYVDDVARDDRGDLAALAFANGTTTTYGYDAERRLVDIDVSGPDGKVLDYTYTRDLRGAVLGVTDAGPRGGGPSATAVYGYDNLHRLVVADLDHGTPQAERIDYTYDAAENLTARVSSRGAASPVHDGARVIDAVRPHAVTQVGDVALAYDDAGRLTSAGARAFAWDGEGRLARVSQDGAVMAEHRYARGSERVRTQKGSETTWFFGPDFDVESGVASMYVRLGSDTVARREYCDLATVFYHDLAPASGPDAALVAVPDGRIDAADAWLAFAAEEGIVTYASGTPSDPDELLAASARQELNAREDRVTWFHHDAVGSVAAVSDEVGAVIESDLRYPFGSLRASSTDARERMAFTGKYEDAASGLVHFDLRDYDPWLARWTAPDRKYAEMDVRALDEPWESFSSYAYVQSSPLDGRDETGADRDDWLRGKSSRSIAIYTHHYLTYGGEPSAPILKMAQEVTHEVTGRFQGEHTSLRLLLGDVGSSAGISTATRFLQRRMAKASTVDEKAIIQGRIDDLHAAYKIATGTTHPLAVGVDLSAGDEVRIKVGAAAPPDALLEKPAPSWLKPHEVAKLPLSTLSAVGFGTALAAHAADEDAMLGEISGEMAGAAGRGRSSALLRDPSRDAPASKSKAAPRTYGKR